MAFCTRCLLIHVQTAEAFSRLAGLPGHDSVRLLSCGRCHVLVLRGRGSVAIWQTISSKSDLAGVLFASSSLEAAAREIEYFFGSTVEV